MENREDSISESKVTEIQESILNEKIVKSSRGENSTSDETGTESKFPQPEIWPERNMKTKQKKAKFKLSSLIDVKLNCAVFGKFCLILFGFIISSIGSGLVLLPVTIFLLIWYENKLKKTNKSKIKAKARAISMSREQIIEKIDELPSWVLFPDRERAEWINDIIQQLWPNINAYLVKFMRTKLENKIRKKYDTFKFEELDFGNVPPKIDGVKVYSKATTRDSILIDFDVFYDGDCDINFSISGHQVGRLKDFQLSVEVRLILKPLMLKAPIVGGVQIFFLNTPDIDFELEGLSGIPGLSHVLRKQLEDKLRKKIVFPNKITKRFTKTVEATELKSLEPEGVIRIHIAEAKDLERRDVTGKSDPYVVISVGAQEYKTSVIKRSLNPKWDEWCEFVILDPMAQQIKFKLFDQDELNEDDFLGSGVVDIKNIYEGSTDHWVNLDGVKHGKIHLRFTWMSLTSDHNSALEKALHEVKLLKVSVSSGLLTVYIDSVRNLPRLKSLKKPDPFLSMHVGDASSFQKSKLKKRTVDPMFEQGFSFLVKNPNLDTFHINIMDKSTNLRIDYFEFEIKNLFNEDNLEFSMREFGLKSDVHCCLIASMQLRILTSETFENREDSSESISDDEFSEILIAEEVVPETPQEIDPPVFPENAPSELNASPIRSPRYKRLQRLSVKSLSSESKHSNNESIVNVVNSGRIHVGLQYSERRQKLIVTIFKITNLPIRDPKDIPDPYVKLKLFSGSNTIRNKTKTIMDNPNPEFKETFEYLLSPSEIAEQKLVLTIKTKKKLFSNNMLGQVLIDLRNVDLIDNEHHNKWYEIGPEVHSE